MTLLPTPPLPATKVLWRLRWQTWLSWSMTNALSRTCLKGYSSVIEPSPWFQIVPHSSIICSRCWKDTLSLRNCTLYPTDTLLFIEFHKCGESHYDWVLRSKIKINQNWDLYANNIHSGTEGRAATSKLWGLLFYPELIVWHFCVCSSLKGFLLVFQVPPTSKSHDSRCHNRMYYYSYYVPRLCSRFTVTLTRIKQLTETYERTPTRRISPVLSFYVASINY